MELTLGGILLFIVILYAVTAFLWGVYAVKRQEKSHHMTTGAFKYLLVFVANTIFMPVCIMIATKELQNESLS